MLNRPGLLRITLSIARSTSSWNDARWNGQSLPLPPPAGRPQDRLLGGAGVEGVPGAGAGVGVAAGGGVGVSWGIGTTTTGIGAGPVPASECRGSSSVIV